MYHYPSCYSVPTVGFFNYNPGISPEILPMELPQDCSVQKSYQDILIHVLFKKLEFYGYNHFWRSELKLKLNGFGKVGPGE